MTGTEPIPYYPPDSLYPFGAGSLQNLNIGLWSYLALEEDEDAGNERFDATVADHHFVFASAPYSAQAEGHVHEFSSEFVGTEGLLQSQHELTFDSIVDPWAFVGWLYLGTPADDADLFTWKVPNGHSNKAKISYTWDGSTLTFRQQVGYFADEETEYANEVSITGLTAPLNQWYFVAAAYRGPSILGHPVNNVMMTLRVNSTSVNIPAPCLDAEVPPIHVDQTRRFEIGPLAGRLGPARIYLNRTLSNADLDVLYNSGAGLLP